MEYLKRKALFTLTVITATTTLGSGVTASSRDQKGKKDWQVWRQNSKRAIKQILVSKNTVHLHVHNAYHFMFYVDFGWIVKGENIVIISITCLPLFSALPPNPD